MKIKRNLTLATLVALIIPAAAIFTGCGCSGEKTGETNGATSGSTSTTPTAAKRPMPTAAGNTDSGSGDIVIGLVASLNGDLKPWGGDCEIGAKMAVAEFNAAGGLNGRNVVLKIEDSQSSPEKGKTACEKLISEGALVVIGEVASGITAQMAQSAFEKGVPVVAVGATRTDLTDIGAHLFRVCYTDAFQGPVMAKFAYEERGKRKIAIMTDKQQPYSTGLSDSFRAYFVKLGGEIVDEQFYESKQTQFSSQLTNIKGKNPDGLFLSGYFNEVGPIARQAKEAGLDMELYGGDGWDSRDILTSGGEAILKGFFCNHYNNYEERPEVKGFIKNWQTGNGGNLPGTTMGALGYDSVKLTLDALKRAAAITSKDIIAALENTEGFAGVSGSITLKGAGGNPQKRALVVGLDMVKNQVFKKAYEPSEVK